MDYDQISIFDDTVKLNDQVEIDSNFDKSMEWFAGRFPHVELCPFCKSPLLMLNDQDDKGPVKQLDYDERFSSLKICQSCMYWQWLYQNPYSKNEYGCPDFYASAGISKVKEYQKEIPCGCHEELAQAIRRNPKIWNSIAPYELEKLVASIFKANHKQCEVIHVGGPNDGGVDVVFVDSGEKQWLIQVKRRENPNATEGVGVLRNLLGSMVLKSTSYGIVVSTADHFTYRAHEAVGLAANVGKTLELIDRGHLDRMVGGLLPDKPWLEFLREQEPAFATKYARKYSAKTAKRKPRVKNSKQLKLF